MLATADIPHQFTVAGYTMPAGRYDIIEDDPDSGTLTLRDDKTGKDKIFAYDTRLAARPDGPAVIVFDKVGDVEYLSEIHLTEQDGYFLVGAKGKRTHVSVPATAKK